MSTFLCHDEVRGTDLRQQGSPGRLGRWDSGPPRPAVTALPPLIPITQNSVVPLVPRYGAGTISSHSIPDEISLRSISPRLFVANSPDPGIRAPRTRRCRVSLPPDRRVRSPRRRRRRRDLQNGNRQIFAESLRRWDQDAVFNFAPLHRHLLDRSSQQIGLTFYAILQ